jgi:hypothetical protein
MSMKGRNDSIQTEIAETGVYLRKLPTDLCAGVEGDLMK